ncbi:MAG: hypothetical protein WCH39_10335 [Schlesneria sp.]
MWLQIESTEEVVDIYGVEHRVWRGVTPKGVECLLLVRRVAVEKGSPMDEFDDDEHLKERPAEGVFSDNPRIPF